MRSVIAGVVAAFLSLPLGAQVKPPSAAPAAAPSPAADVEPPRPSAPRSTGRPGGGLECLVEPSLIVNVGSSVDGVLEQVLVDRGATVRKGQVVARLQSGVESAAVQLSEARVEFGRRKVERNESLYAKQLISAQDRDELVTEVKLREEELKKDRETLRLRTIVSPIDGVVVDRRLAPGDFIRTDKAMVMRLAQINPLNIEVVAPASIFGSVKVGMTGIVNLEPFVSGTHKAKVVVVDKVIDAASGTLGVRLQLPNPDHRIPAGIKCSVEFAK